MSSNNSIKCGSYCYPIHNWLSNHFYAKVFCKNFKGFQFAKFVVSTSIQCLNQFPVTKNLYFAVGRNGAFHL